MTDSLIGMGRLVEKDERNRGYALTPPAVIKAKRRYWFGSTVLDQGATPECVGYAGFGWLLSGPVINKPTTFTPHDLYKWAQERDETPGTNYEGTSTLGLMKALKDKGYISGYNWAFDAITLVNWILSKGPVLVGTNFTQDMANPDTHTAFMTYTGQNLGGHEWRIVGADLDKVCSDGTRGAVRMINSWGKSWADGGRAWISIADLDKLIKDDGEAVTATEIKL